MTEATHGGTPYLEALAGYQHEFASTIPRADPRTPVPWCGRWRVSNLVEHLARIHHWAAAQARRKQETPLGRGPFDLEQLYAECAAELRDTLAELDPGARAWTLLDQGVPKAEQRGTVAFWHRRQTLETLVHLWDLRTAIGEPFEPGPGAWLDCVDEVVTVMHPRQIRLGRVAAPGVRVRLHPTDGGEPLDLVAAADAATAVTVTGSARQLALLLWGRADADQLEIAGDREALAAVLAAGLTP